MNIVNELLVYCNSKGYKIRINEAEKKGPPQFTGGDWRYDVGFMDWKGHEEITYSEGKCLYEGPPLVEAYKSSESSPVPSFDDPYYSRVVSEHFWITAFDDNQQRVITWRIYQDNDDSYNNFYWSFLEVNGVRFRHDRDLDDQQVDDATQAWLDERAIVAPYLYQIDEKISQLYRS